MHFNFSVTCFRNPQLFTKFLLTDEYCFHTSYFIYFFTCDDGLLPDFLFHRLRFLDRFLLKRQTGVSTNGLVTAAEILFMIEHFKCFQFSQREE